MGIRSTSEQQKKYLKVQFPRGRVRIMRLTRPESGTTHSCRNGHKVLVKKKPALGPLRTHTRAHKRPYHQVLKHGTPARFFFLVIMGSTHLKLNVGCLQHLFSFGCTFYRFSSCIPIPLIPLSFCIHLLPLPPPPHKEKIKNKNNTRLSTLSLSQYCT